MPFALEGEKPMSSKVVCCVDILKKTVHNKAVNAFFLEDRLKRKRPMEYVCQYIILHVIYIYLSNHLLISDSYTQIFILFIHVVIPFF